MRVGNFSHGSNTRSGRTQIKSPHALMLTAVAFILSVALCEPAQANPMSERAPTASSMSSRAAATTEVVAIRAKVNNHYVVAENAGQSPLIANRTAIGPWERFDLIRINSTEVNVRAQVDGQFVTAESAGASPLISNRDIAGPWETFELINNADGTSSLRARANNKIVTAESAGNAPLIANRTAVGLWEKFDLVTLSSENSNPTPSPSSWPGPANTGVPLGTSLTPYTGPCTITTANTAIDAKTIACDLTIRAAGVKISRSNITGTVSTDSNSSGYSFTISDSYVNAGDGPYTGIGAVDFTATRVQVVGGNRSILCFRSCTIQDSYVHGQFTDSTGVAHESGIRMGEGTTLRHNTILCDAPDVAPEAGCSADLTGYGDFAVVQNNTIDNNLFKASTGGFCAYGGSTKGKPYSSGANNVRFTNNVFERGPGGKCGFWGPITAYDSARPGNVWSGNVWDDGSPVAPAN